MEYVLIIILYTSSTFDPRGSIAVTNVSGFKDKKFCEAAMMQTRTRNNVDSFCIQVK